MPFDTIQKAGIEVSVVIPCLNEADSVGDCVTAAWRAAAAAGVDAEIVVADNGSDDGSGRLAEEAGARVVPVPEKGYGSALMGGIEAARGSIILMGDADGSYDFAELPKFVDKIRQGYDLVQGCRLPSGGGVVLPGAMPALHRWWGNPMFTWLVRWWFRAPVHDVYCGLRAFRKEWQQSLDQRCTGMEFATEMIIKTSLLGGRVAEVPITLRPDKRRSHAPHLRTFRDGWQTLRFFMMYCPRWLYLAPGRLLILLGLAGYALAMPRTTIGGATLDAHTLLFSSLAIIAGYQALCFGVFTKTFAISEGLLPSDKRMQGFIRKFSVEKGVATGLAGMIAGLLLLLSAVAQWRAVHFGELDYAKTMRWVIPGVTLTALGFQTILASFFVGILLLRRK